MGKVIEIVYGEDENPNDGQYVIVDFTQYCGLPWMIEHPLCFPIPCIIVQPGNKTSGRNMSWITLFVFIMSNRYQY